MVKRVGNRKIEETEELKRVIAELQAKVNSMEQGDEEEIEKALLGTTVTEESYVAYRGEDADASVPEEGAEAGYEKYEEEADNNAASEAANEIAAEPEREVRRKRKSRKIKQEDAIITMEHVTKSYVKGIPALDDVNITINKGEFVFIVGESGSGKSTLIRLLLREIKPTGGKIVVNGFQVEKLRQGKVSKLRRSMGVVFQDFRLLKDRNVYENVAFAQRIIQAPPKQMKRNVSNMLSVVGLASKYRAMPHELSGGERQRVALARALVNKPPILLADEPTGNLDPRTTVEIMDLLEQINKSGTTVIVVTHNEKIVNDMQKRVITIKNGVVVSDEKKGGYIDEN